jgi:hypothetical protein
MLQIFTLEKFAILTFTIPKSITELMKITSIHAAALNFTDVFLHFTNTFRKKNDLSHMQH